MNTVNTSRTGKVADIVSVAPWR